MPGVSEKLEFTLLESATLGRWDEFSGKGQHLERNLRARKDIVVEDGRQKEVVVLFYQTGNEGLLEKIQNWWFAKEQRGLAQAYLSTISTLAGGFDNSTQSCFKDIENGGLTAVHAEVAQWTVERGGVRLKPALDALLRGVSSGVDASQLRKQLVRLAALLGDVSPDLKMALMVRLVRKHMQGFVLQQKLDLYTRFLALSTEEPSKKALVTGRKTTIRPPAWSASDSALALSSVLKDALAGQLREQISGQKSELEGLSDYELTRYAKVLRAGNIAVLGKEFDTEITDRLQKKCQSLFAGKSLASMTPHELAAYRKLLEQSGLSGSTLGEYGLFTMDQIDAAQLDPRIRRQVQDLVREILQGFLPSTSVMARPSESHKELRAKLGELAGALKNIAPGVQNALLARVVGEEMQGLPSQEKWELYARFMEQAGETSLREAFVAGMGTSRKRQPSAFGSPLSLFSALKTELIGQFKVQASIQEDALEKLDDRTLIRYGKALRAGNLRELASKLDGEIVARFQKKIQRSFGGQSLADMPPHMLVQYRKLVEEYGLSDRVLDNNGLITLDQIGAEQLKRAKESYANSWEKMMARLSLNKPRSKPLSADAISGIVEKFFKSGKAICADYELRATFAAYAKGKENNQIKLAPTMRRFHRYMIAQLPPDIQATVPGMLALLRQQGQVVQHKPLTTMLELLTQEPAKPIPKQDAPTARRRASVARADSVRSRRDSMS